MVTTYYWIQWVSNYAVSRTLYNIVHALTRCCDLAESFEIEHMIPYKEVHRFESFPSGLGTFDSHPKGQNFVPYDTVRIFPSEHVP